MATITLFKTTVRNRLIAESTNAARTFVRNDGVSDFESVVIDQQSYDSLAGAWHEAVARLTEKMHEFLSDTTIDGDSSVEFVFTADEQPDGLEDNLLMYVVDWMMGDWLSAVRPDHSKRYYDRAAMQMDDLLRKLYKKEAPV